MKLLFDQNVSPRLVNRLAVEYPGSAHVSTLGLDQALDARVWVFARDHGYVIVSKDADFSDMSVLLGFPQLYGFVLAIVRQARLNSYFVSTSRCSKGLSKIPPQASSSYSKRPEQ